MDEHSRKFHLVSGLLKEPGCEIFKIATAGLPLVVCLWRLVENVLFYCSIEMTVTDLGSTFRISLPSCTFTEIGVGATTFGASKLLTLSTFGAVRVCPTADLAVMPRSLALISAGWFGSMF